MANIPQTYCSPLTRWALCVEDYPNASHIFDVVSGSELGIPDDFGGRGLFLRATIDFGSGNQRKRAVGWKPLAGEKKTPDAYNVLCTKALGRALKRAGYPDDLDDLRACVLWRQRRAEIAAIEGHPPAGALGAGDALDDALTAAAVSDPDHVGVDDQPDVHRDAPISARAYDGDGYGGGIDDEHDDTSQSNGTTQFNRRSTDHEQIIDAQLVDTETGQLLTDDAEPSVETITELRQAITDAAKTKTQPALRAWAKDQGWTAAAPPTEQAARAIIDKATELAEGPL